MKHHVVISGTGRAGTTLLVQLLTILGMDTGFESPTSQIFPNCNAGMEHDLRHPGAPYFVKDPQLCDYLDEVIRGGGIVVDHAIVPMRELYSAAESRREVSRKAGPGLEPDQIPGGLWLTTSPDEQEDVLARQVYKLLCAIADHDIPITLLSFPRFVTDPQYLYGKIGFLLGAVSLEAFLEGFHRVSNPELVHDFSARRSRTLAGPAHSRESGAS